MWQIQRRGILSDARGFTLAEVMITIVIMGILTAIAIPSWFSMVKSRAVDSATNQLVADLRLAHVRATNQLTDWAVVTNPASVTAAGFSFQGGPPSGKDYYLVKLPDSTAIPIPALDVKGRFLEENGRAQIDSSTPINMRFKPDGSVTITGASTIQIHVTNALYNSNPHHNITVNATTSRIKVD